MSSDANDSPLQPQDPTEGEGQTSPEVENDDTQAAARRKILIGSQRDPDAYKPKPKRDWVSGKKGEKKEV